MYGGLTVILLSDIRDQHDLLRLGRSRQGEGAEEREQRHGGGEQDGGSSSIGASHHGFS